MAPTTATQFGNWIMANIPEDTRKGLSNSSGNWSSYPWPSIMDTDTKAAQLFEAYPTDVISVINDFAEKSGYDTLTYVGQSLPGTVINSTEQLHAAFARCGVLSYLRGGYQP